MAARSISKSTNKTIPGLYPVPGFSKDFPLSEFKFWERGMQLLRENSKVRRATREWRNSLTQHQYSLVLRKYPKIESLLSIPLSNKGYVIPGMPKGFPKCPVRFWYGRLMQDLPHPESRSVKTRKWFFEDLTHDQQDALCKKYPRLGIFWPRTDRYLCYKGNVDISIIKDLEKDAKDRYPKGLPLEVKKTLNRRKERIMKKREESLLLLKRERMPDNLDTRCTLWLDNSGNTFLKLLQIFVLYKPAKEIQLWFKRKSLTTRILIVAIPIIAVGLFLKKRSK